MVFKVQTLQCPVFHLFSSTEFAMFLVGLCDAGRSPKLHISSARQSSRSGIQVSSSDVNFDYSVIIDVS